METLAIVAGLLPGLAMIPARAEVSVDVTLAAAGPGAAPGIPEKHRLALVGQP